MKRVFGMLFAFSTCLTVAGCGGTGDNQNVMENAERSAIEEYEAAVAADAAAMDSDMKSETATP